MLVHVWGSLCGAAEWSNELNPTSRHPARNCPKPSPRMGPWDGGGGGVGICLAVSPRHQKRRWYKTNNQKRQENRNSLHSRPKCTAWINAVYFHTRSDWNADLHTIAELRLGRVCRLREAYLAHKKRPPSACLSVFINAGLFILGDLGGVSFSAAS